MAEADAARPPPLRIKVDTPGHLDFVNASTQWTEWLKRFQRFRNIGGLAEQSNAVQIDSLLYIMGPESEDVYAQLQFTGDEADRTFKAVVDAFTAYFQPRRIVLNYWTQFYNREQSADESAEEYICSVHNLAVKCRFDTGLTQNDMVKDRLLSGMSDTSLSSELQLDEDVTLDAVISKMRAKEAIVKQMQLETKAAAVKLTGTAKSNQKQTPTRMIRDCKYCGGSHPPRSCPAFGKKCNKCSKVNHFERVCKQSRAQAAEVTVKGTAESEDSDFFIHTPNLHADAVSNDTKTIYVDRFDSAIITHAFSITNEWLEHLVVNGQVLKAKIDTGAQANVITSNELQRVAPNSVINPSRTRLTAYSGHVLPVVGVSEMEIYKGQKHSLSFHILKGKRTAHTLIGLGKCRIAGQFPDVFVSFGKLNITHSIILKPNAEPYSCPPRSVPHALKAKLKFELERLVSLGIIAECKEPSEWVNQIVPVLKPDGSLRICLDPQQLNAVTIRDRYVLPTISDIYARLSGSIIYTTLDAQSGFHQIPIDEQSSKLTTFMTPFGRFRYLRLPFGLTSASEFFHRTMVDIVGDIPGVDIVGDIPGVEVHIDDVLIHGTTEKEHDERLKGVLTRFRAAGLKLNAKKCQFRAQSVKFLGNILSKDGIRPSPDKVRAIQNAKQ